ncbi:MAG: hypothetical protein ABL949_13435 [Fimbriimonadaceae bacterium]
MKCEYPVSLVHPFSNVSVVAAFWGLILAALSGVGISNPPEFNPAWVVIWGSSILGALLSVASVHQENSLQNRKTASAGLGMALLASWLPTYAYFGNYHEYPWIVVGGLAVVSVGGGFVVGLRVVPALS